MNTALTYPAAIQALGNWDAYAARQRADRINAGHDIDGGKCCTFHSMDTRAAKESYAAYMQDSIAEHVALGHYSEEWAMGATLSDMLAGNDGA